MNSESKQKLRCNQEEIPYIFTRFRNCLNCRVRDVRLWVIFIPQYPIIIDTNEINEINEVNSKWGIVTIYLCIWLVPYWISQSAYLLTKHWIFCYRTSRYITAESIKPPLCVIWDPRKPAQNPIYNCLVIKLFCRTGYHLGISDSGRVRGLGSTNELHGNYTKYL